jgi:hypothetical protein
MFNLADNPPLLAAISAISASKNGRESERRCYHRVFGTEKVPTATALTGDIACDIAQD